MELEEKIQEEIGEIIILNTFATCIGKLYIVSGNLRQCHVYSVIVGEVSMNVYNTFFQQYLPPFLPQWKSCV